ncbi:AraC family transcriptional regulator [Paenibacillus psychroresistens]|nr:AraC family transcriptional regulator [Paenibacillus psychroresistens]
MDYSSEQMDVDFSNLAPYVRFVQKYEGDDTYKLPRRIIYDYEIVLVLQGKWIYTIDNQGYEVNAGDMLIVPPYIQHSCYVPKGESIQYYAIHFDLVYLGKKFDFSADEIYNSVDYQHIDFVPVDDELTERPLVEFSEVKLPYWVQLKEPFLVVSHFQEALTTFTEKPYGYMISLRCTMLKIIGFILKELTTSNGVDKQHSHQEEVTATIQYMYEHLTEEIDFNDIAHSLFLSPNYFRTLFKQATGKSTVEYLTSIRLEKAKALMQAGNLTIKAISEAVGYNDLQYFSKTFKKFEGLSPKGYVHSLSIHPLR